MSRRGVAAGVVVATLAGVCSAARINTISLHAFHHAMAQWVGLRGPRSAPKPGDRGYGRAKKSVLTDRLERIDLQGQAQEMGITAPAWEVARAVASIKHKNFKNHATTSHFSRNPTTREATCSNR